MPVRYRSLYLQFAVVAGILVFWAFGDMAGLFNPAVLPPLAHVGSALVTVVGRAEFFPALQATLFDSINGVIFAAIFAVPLGILIGMYPAIERATRTILDFGRSFPVVALIPIFVLILGSNSLMKVTMSAIACFFPILLQSIYGARRMDPTIVDTIQSFKIPFWLRFTQVLLPAAAPFISTGIRLAISISILVCVGTEVLTQITGIGAEINLSRIYNEVDIAFAYLIYAGLMGVALTFIWDAMDRRLLGWHHKANAV